MSSPTEVEEVNKDAGVNGEDDVVNKTETQTKAENSEDEKHLNIFNKEPWNTSIFKGQFLDSLDNGDPMPKYDSTHGDSDGFADCFAELADILDGFIGGKECRKRFSSTDEHALKWTVASLRDSAEISKQVWRW